MSINDAEAPNLRLILDELFGEEAFIGQLVWKSRQNKDNRNITGLSIDHEYVVCYGKQIRGSSRKLEQYSNPDNDPRGPWTSGNMVGLQPENARPNLHYDLIDPETRINYGRPPLGWRYERTTMDRLIKEKRILWPSTGEGRPRRKVFLAELKQNTTGFSSIIGNDLYTRDGSAEIDELFGFRAFDFPKPSGLIRELIIQGTELGDIVLDFFSGSCTTAHAVLSQNHEDGGNRRFIMIQLPEPTDSRKYPNIAAIGKERIRRVIKRMKHEAKDQLELNQRETPEDLGFRVYKLVRSNFSSWQDYTGEDIHEVETLFDKAQTPLVESWQEDDLLAEVMLLEGFPLDSSITELSNFKRNTLKQVESDARAHRLLACFDRKIHDDTIQCLYALLAERPEDVFVCLDSAVTDEAKMRLADAGNLKTI